jgi:peroxiredoxin 1
MESKNPISYIPKAFIRHPAPQFNGTVWHSGRFQEIKLSDFKGKYLVLFFYPLDFTFVCPTEICNFSDAYEKFKSIDCELIGCSTDSKFSHREWALKPRKQGGLEPCNLPLLSDKSQDISKDYGVLIDSGSDKGVAFRGTFIIDDKGILRHSSINDLPVGRSVDEILRLVQAFQFSDKHGEVCPAKWKPGERGIIVEKIPERKEETPKEAGANMGNMSPPLPSDEGFTIKVSDNKDIAKCNSMCCHQ